MGISLVSAHPNIYDTTEKHFFLKPMPHVSDVVKKCFDILSLRMDVHYQLPLVAPYLREKENAMDASPRGVYALVK